MKSISVKCKKCWWIFEMELKDAKVDLLASVSKDTQQVVFTCPHCGEKVRKEIQKEDFDG